MLVIQRQSVPIHPHVALLVVITSVINLLYVFLVVGVGFNFERDGRLIFISEAFQAYCGWSGVILGTTGAIEALVQLIAAVHMDSTLCIASTAVQFLAWNVILGVSDTGWTLHYVALVMFFFATCLFHWIASRSTQYSGALYQQANLISVVVVILFGGLFLGNGVGNFTDKQRKSIVSAEVSIEFVLLFTTLVEQFCLAYGIAKCTRLLIVFDDVVYSHS